MTHLQTRSLIGGAGVVGLQPTLVRGTIQSAFLEANVLGYSKGRQSSPFLCARTAEQMRSLAQAAEPLCGPIVRAMKNCLLPRLPGSASVLDFGHLGLQLRFGFFPGQTDNKRTTQRDSPGFASSHSQRGCHPARRLKGKGTGQKCRVHL